MEGVSVQRVIDNPDPAPSQPETITVPTETSIARSPSPRKPRSASKFAPNLTLEKKRNEAKLANSIDLSINSYLDHSLSRELSDEPGSPKNESQDSKKPDSVIFSSADNRELSEQTCSSSSSSNPSEENNPEIGYNFGAVDIRELRNPSSPEISSISESESDSSEYEHLFETSSGFDSESADEEAVVDRGLPQGQVLAHEPGVYADDRVEPEEAVITDHFSCPNSVGPFIRRRILDDFGTIPNFYAEFGVTTRVTTQVVQGRSMRTQYVTGVETNVREAIRYLENIFGDIQRIVVQGVSFDGETSQYMRNRTIGAWLRRRQREAEYHIKYHDRN